MKRRALVEVMLVWCGVFLLVETAAWNPLARWCSRLGEWNYFSHIVIIVVPLAVIGLARRSWREYGLTLASWRSGLAWGGGVAAAIALPYLAAHAIGIVAFDRSRPILDTLVFQFVMAGFGEEILNRGYYQSRLNQGFGRPWSILNVNFGWGLILTNLIFAFDHVLNPFHPFHGQFQFDVLWGLAVLPSTLMFAALRERTAGILAPAIVHGIEDVCFCFTAPGSAAMIVTSLGSMLGWAVFILALWRFRPERGLPGQCAGEVIGLAARPET